MHFDAVCKQPTVQGLVRCIFMKALAIFARSLGLTSSFDSCLWSVSHFHSAEIANDDRTERLRQFMIRWTDTGSICLEVVIAKRSSLWCLSTACPTWFPEQQRELVCWTNMNGSGHHALCGMAISDFPMFGWSASLLQSLVEVGRYSYLLATVP